MGSINRDNNDVENGSSSDASAPATFGGLDWSTLLIEEEETDDYTVHVQEDTMYNLLGLEEEDQTVNVLRQAANDANAALVHANISVIDATAIEGAALPVDDLAPVEHFTFFDRDNPQMAVGDTFPSMDNFRMALKHYAIKREFDIKIIMSQPKKYMAYCKKFEDGCPFKITAKKKQEGTTVVVTEFEDKHMCTSSSRKKTSMASQSWVAERAEIIMKNDPDMSAIDLQKKLQSDYNVKVPYHTVYKGRQRAIVDLYGSWEESFRLLYNFKAEIELRSPGSVVEIATKEVEGKTFFDKFFIAFKPCIDGFLSGCRPYLSIDSTHLNGKWNGHLAAVTALDGHNWMFPVAFGFFDAETTENWTWFMSQLKKAIGDPPVLAVCTDACKGLENAVKNVFPNAEQRECFRHLMGNAVKKFHGEKFSHMWPAAKAYKKSKFDWHMKQVFMEEPKVHTYLELYHNLLWMRCMFNTSIKVDYIHNNLAECFNSWVRHIKDLPIVQLCDKLREMVMELLRKRRRIGERLQGKILPAIIQELNNRTRGLGHLKTHVSSDLSAEVRDTEKEHIRHVVKALTCECTCLEWQHTGKPCPHALVVLTALPNVKLEDFVDDYYSVEKFKAAYQGEIEPITDKTQWPVVDLGFVLHAPLPKRGAGRHRQLRIKGALEGGSGNKPKVGGLNQCKKCHELGHREAGCTYNGAKKRNGRRNEAPWEDGSTSKTVETSSPTTMFPISPAKTPRNVSPCSPTAVKRSHTTISPGPVTRSQTAISPGPVTRSQAAMCPAKTPVKSPLTSVQKPLKKLTPKRRKLNL